MGTKFIKGNNYNIPKNAIVKIEEYANGRIVVTYSAVKRNNLGGYINQGDGTYYDFTTKTFRPYKKNPKKSNNNLNRSLNHTLRPLLENNFFGGSNEVFVTLTYAEPMKNLSQLSKDYDRFWRRLCNYYNNLNLACVYIKEMQEKRQSWHIHSIIKETNNKNLNIPFKLLRQMWELGNVWINKVLPNENNSDFQISIEKEMSKFRFGGTHRRNEIIDYMCKPKSKNNVFPSGVRIYGNKGKLKGPKTSKGAYGEAYNTKLQNSILVKQDNTLVIDEDTNCIRNSIQKEDWIEAKHNGSNDPLKL